MFLAKVTGRYSRTRFLSKAAGLLKEREGDRIVLTLERGQFAGAAVDGWIGAMSTTWPWFAHWKAPYDASAVSWQRGLEASLPNWTLDSDVGTGFMSAAYPVLDLSEVDSLPVGANPIFFFAIDLVPNGLLDTELLFVDMLPLAEEVP